MSTTIRILLTITTTSKTFDPPLVCDFQPQGGSRVLEVMIIIMVVVSTVGKRVRVMN